jgi:competence ComEA-like helix-hairpin-helix protein
MLLDRKDPDNRSILKGYDKEFESFWNNDDMALLYGEARKEKNRLYSEIYEAHGESFTPYNVADDTIPDPVYESFDNSDAFDINSFGDGDTAELVSVVGKRAAGKIQRELRDYGRFDTWTELLARVPDVAKLDTWKRELLMENLDYGDGGLSINTATVEELDRAGLTPAQSQRIVDFREQHGAFESLDELDDIRGIGQKTIDRLRDVLTDDHVVGTYSATAIGEETTTGWAEEHQGTMSVVAEHNDGSVEDGKFTPNHRLEGTEEIERTLAAPVIDMLRRTKPGETYRMGMYGMSTNSDEFKALEKAIGRGVKVRVVIYKAYNAGAIDKLKELKAEGFDVDLRVVKSRVMHEKFGVAGDDVFNGSSNWSRSSIGKHSEDRFLFRNEPELADRFVEEFARLWEKGYEP